MPFITMIIHTWPWNPRISFEKQQPAKAPTPEIEECVYAKNGRIEELAAPL
jgi:hypothetical protein